MSGPGLPPPPGTPAVRAALLRWYFRHRRDLPWRHTRDPYAIWISEVMLQQTRVATVVPYYRRFLERFPDIGALARASEESVLGLWSGLGYYRRARSLHACARVVAERHAGKLPPDPPALLALPGFGRYTAGAVASLAFGLEEPVLDGNVRRVLSRLFRVSEPVVSRLDRRLWPIAASLVRGPDPGDLNQALMELGAVVCVPRDPDCRSCPLERYCAARAEGSVASYPPPRPRPAVVGARVVVAWMERRGRVLLERSGSGGPLRGAWDLPSFELGRTAASKRAVVRGMRARHGVEVEAGAPLGRFAHSILNRRLCVELVACPLVTSPASGDLSLRWVALSQMDVAPVSGATRKAVALRLRAARPGVAPAAALPRP